MAAIDMKKWISEIRKQKERVAVPVMTHPGIELIGKNVLDAVSNGEIHHQAIMALEQKYPAAATTVIMDLTVEAEAFGAQIHFSKNEVPAVVARLLKDEDDIHNLQIPELNIARIPDYIKANRLTAQAITDKPVLAGCIGPFSLAGRLYDMSEMMMLPYINPEAASLLLEKCTVFLIHYCKALKETGVSGIVIAEPAAGLLSNEDCLNSSSIYIQSLVKEVQDDYFAVVLHNCGNTGHCTKAMVSTGAMGYHFGNAIHLPEAAKQVPESALVFGNIDPVGLFKAGTPEMMYNAVMQLLKNMTAFPNYILSSGCDTPPHSPIENIDAFYKALKDYNAN